jgi:hypothetical protein
LRGLRCRPNVVLPINAHPPIAATHTIPAGFVRHIVTSPIGRAI